MVQDIYQLFPQSEFSASYSSTSTSTKKYDFKIIWTTYYSYFPLFEMLPDLKTEIIY